MKHTFTEKPSRIVVSAGRRVTYMALNYNYAQTDEGWEADSVLMESKDGAPSVSDVVKAIIASGSLCSIEELESIGNAIADTFHVAVDSGELLGAAKDLLRTLSSTYGSEDVNVFHYEGKDLWIDKQTRAAILSRIDAEEDNGKTTTNVSANDFHFFNIPIASVRMMLKGLESYAAKCFDMTQSHKLAIEDLETYEEVRGYDYKGGYPEPLAYGDEIFTYVQQEPTAKEVVKALKKLALPMVLKQDDDAALDNVELFPSWESMIGKEVKQGERYYYDKALWKVVQTHTAQADWNPRVAVSLFTQVVKSEGGGVSDGEAAAYGETNDRRRTKDDKRKTINEEQKTKNY